MPNYDEVQRGWYFDLLDQTVAASAYALLQQSTISPQTYSLWSSDFNDLKAYAQQYDWVPYVHNQWASEQPRYAQIVNALSGKVRVGNPANYDTTISISGGGCGCGGNRTPEDAGTHIGGINIGSGGTQLSLGDTLRNQLTPGQRIAQEVGSDVLKGIITAAVIGAVLWIAHYYLKKKKKKASS